MTEKLYLEDPLALTFSARVTELGEWDGRTSLCLDRSAFYGEAGGQVGDRGSLMVEGRQVTVVDTQYDRQGRLHHLVSGELAGLLPGVEVAGEVDFDHRRDMMSQHTGQHLLSATCYKVCKADTVSARLGATSGTIDLDRSELSPADLESIASLANRVVLEDRPVRALYPGERELAGYDLRRAPKVDKDIRLIEIEDFDLTPCGGTHCLRTGQIVPIHITGRERVKGMTRLHFLAGGRAIEDHRRQADLLIELGEALGSGAAGVAEGIAGLRRDLAERNRELGEARAALVASRRDQLFAAHPPAAGGTTPILVVSEQESPASLRALAAALAQREDVVALVACKDEKSALWRVILACGDKAGCDAGAWFRTRAAALGGRGGGRPGRAEGTLPASVDLPALDLFPPT